MIFIILMLCDKKMILSAKNLKKKEHFLKIKNTTIATTVKMISVRSWLAATFTLT